MIKGKTCICDCCEHVDAVRIGEIVPDIAFRVYHKDNDIKMRLGDFKGRWLILFFYPADFTFVCPTELEAMENHYDGFLKEGAEVVSVSTDSVYVHKAWRDASPSIKKIQFPMASDRTHELSHAFGVHIENEGNSLRGSFIIDSDGILQSYEVNADGIGRNAEELLRKFQAAKFVHDNGNKVCPANWHPGDDTLQPGLDLVGKI